MPDQTHPVKQPTARPLSQLAVGQAGWIVAIKTRNSENRRELASLGISPQAIVRMFADHKSHFIFKMNGKTFAADREIAAVILVHPLF